MTADLHYLTLAEAAELIRARKLSPLEYTETLVKRIETFEPQLNAFITRTFELARTHARAAEADIAAGNYRGRFTASRSRSRISTTRRGS